MLKDTNMCMLIWLPVRALNHQLGQHCGICTLCSWIDTSRPTKPVHYTKQPWAPNMYRNNYVYVDTVTSEGPKSSTWVVMQHMYREFID